MNIETLELRIAEHALIRYCERVAPISRADLESAFRKQFVRGYRFKKGYLQVGGIWWRASRKANVLTLHTCYGQTHIDIPEAVRWAKRNRDRIGLGGHYGD